MGRPRQFDTEEAIQSAIEVFWSFGYEGSRLAELVAEMGIGRQSVYSFYGDKRCLFLAALDRYTEDELERVAEMSARGAGVEEIAYYVYERTERFASDPRRRGCFLVNAVAELASFDEEVALRGEHYLEQLWAAFGKALRTSIRRREIRLAIGPTVLSRQLTAGSIGLAILAKAGATRRQLFDSADAVLANLD